jgi:hypothetical protein
MSPFALALRQVRRSAKQPISITQLRPNLSHPTVSDLLHQNLLVEQRVLQQSCR